MKECSFFGVDQIFFDRWNAAQIQNAARINLVGIIDPFFDGGCREFKRAGVLRRMWLGGFGPFIFGGRLIKKAGPMEKLRVSPITFLISALS